MANVLAPFGFEPLGRFDGASWSANQTTYQILYSNTHKIYSGDPVTLLTTGYIDTLAPGSVSSTVMPCGIFWGCSYISSAQGRLTFSAFYPGGDQITNGIVNAYVIDDPNVMYRVQQGGTGGPLVQADVGGNATYAYGTGSTLTGISGAYLDYGTVPTTTAALPLRVLNLIADPPGDNGTDTTTQYNLATVMWNNEFYRQLTGI